MEKVESERANKWVGLREIPKPEALDDEWFDRLNTSEPDRRRYKHLTNNELKWLEANRQLVDHYTSREILKEDRTAKSLLNDMAETLDKIWLKAGKGRAVDFRGAFNVLESYTEYLDWTKKFKNQMTILDVTLPYCFRKDRLYGADGLLGFINIIIKVYDPSFDRVGQIVWRNINIEITEIETGKPGEQLNMQDSYKFMENPYSFLKPDASRRLFTQRLQDKKIVYLEGPGLVNYLIGMCQIICGDGVVPPNQAYYEHLFHQEYHHGNQYIDSLIEMNIHDGSSEKLQKFLDYLAQLIYHFRIPYGFWQWDFNVADDLTQVECVKTPKNGADDGMPKVFYQLPDRNKSS